LVDPDVKELLISLQKRETDFSQIQHSFDEISEWVTKNKPILKAERYFALHIKGMETLKRTLALQLLTPHKPIHILVLGDPASGKSEIALSFARITPDTGFAWGSKLTAAGLTLARLGKVLAIGLLPRCHFGAAYIDEFNLTPKYEASAILASMAQGFFGVEKANLKVSRVPSKTCITALANPKGDYFISNHPLRIKQQIPFTSKALLTRFHLIHIVLRPTVEEFSEISEHQIKYRMKDITFGFDKKEIALWKDYITYTRRIKISEWQSKGRIVKLVELFSKGCYQQDLKGKLAVPISPRLNEGILNIAEAFARAELSRIVRFKHALKAVILTAKLLRPLGLNTGKIYRTLKRELALPMGE